MKNKVLTILSVCFLIASYCFAQDPGYYKKKSTWLQTLIASRETFIKQQNEINSRIKLVLEPWYSVGYFRCKPGDSFKKNFPPEDRSDLNATYDNDKYKWEKRSGWEDGTVIKFKPIENSVIYLQRNIKCDRDTNLKAYLGSDDGLKAWLNGKLIISHDVDRACSPNEDTADLNLIEGVNKLFVKVNNNNGDFGFYFSLHKRDPKEYLWSLIERDFPTTEDIKEITWVQQSGIWLKDWIPGDYTDIAKKYSDAVKEISPKIAAEILSQAPGAKSIPAIEKINSEFEKAIEGEYVILTPQPSPEPKINGPQIYGVRPGNPFLYRIPVTGVRPMKFSVENLPEGLHLNSQKGIITGTIEKKGEFILTFKAENKLGSAERKFKIVCGNKIALTPPMGWNSWNCFASSVSEKKVHSAAEAMIKSGLVNHGWSYINIDDYWETKPGSDDSTLIGKPRDKEGNIIPNKRFPDMKALADFIHSNGLKMGIYSSPGPLTCGGCIGSLGHEENDAEQYGRWGVDYLKYDWCSYDGDRNNIHDLMKPYIVMRKALNTVKRDIVFSLCQYGMGNVWEWGAKVGGNSWRTTGDINDTWDRMSQIGFSQDSLAKYAGPGHWNDPDMLVVGLVGWGENLHPTRLTPNEQYTHISLWCLLSAPLLIGCDMTKLDKFTLGLLTNDEVLAVDQDTLGIQASRVSRKGDAEVWAKKLEDGSEAVGLFNRGSKKIKITAGFKVLGLGKKCSVRDLWRQKDLGLFENQFTAEVPPHGVVLVKIKNQ